MAISPTFVASLDTLRQRLRLSGLADDSDAQVMFEQAVKIARSTFHRRLTHARVVIIQAYTATDTPATNNEYLKAMAEEAEVKIVRRELLSTMPSLFMDSAGDAQEIWDREAPFRGTSQFGRDRLRQQLTNEIEELMEILEGTDSAGSETSFRATVINPDTAPARLGRSVWD